MRLRTRLAVVFLVLLLTPICVMSIVAIDRSIGLMIDDLGRSADLLAQQIFGQMQVILADRPRDSAEALRDSPALRKLLDSTQAFGQGVVSASIMASNGNVIASAGGQGEGRPAPVFKPFESLQVSSADWLPFGAIGRFWTADIYEVRRPVMANDRLLATISVGVSSALIADRLRSAILIVVVTAAIDTVVAWVLLSLITGRLLNHLSQIELGFEKLVVGREEVEIRSHGAVELDALTNRFNDLSRRVRAERAQLATRDHLFDVVRSLRDAIVMLDDAGSILFANSRARELLVEPGEKIEGESIKSILGAGHQLVALVTSTLETGAEAHDITLDLPHGISVLISVFRLGRGRTPAGLLLLLRDLQSVIELETALDDSNRLARLGALISGVAHQLRGPLHVMNLRLELLKGDDGENKDRHIDRLRQEIERLDQSIEALLRFLRPEALKIVDFDANQLIRELGARVRDDQVRVEYLLEEPLPPVRADRSMISESVSNIITNAVQAMPDGGTLSLQSRRAGETVELLVVDTGIGIEKETLAQIFDLYYSTKPKGNGLGLPLALRAIELNRGKIEIESQPGAGTTCTISLRAASESSSTELLAGNSGSA